MEGADLTNSCGRPTLARSRSISRSQWVERSGDGGGALGSGPDLDMSESGKNDEIVEKSRVDERVKRGEDNAQAAAAAATAVDKNRLRTWHSDRWQFGRTGSVAGSTAGSSIGDKSKRRTSR